MSFKQAKLAIMRLILWTDAVVSNLNASCTIASKYYDLLFSASLGVKNVNASWVSDFDCLASDSMQSRSDL